MDGWRDLNPDVDTASGACDAAVTALDGIDGRQTGIRNHDPRATGERGVAGIRVLLAEALVGLTRLALITLAMLRVAKGGLIGVLWSTRAGSAQ